MFALHTGGFGGASLFTVAALHLLPTIGCEPSGHSYKEFTSPADLERRDRPLTEDSARKEFDLTATEGSPDAYRQAVSGPFQTVCDELNVTPIYTVCCHAERNTLKANLAKSADQWRWSILYR